MRNDTVSYTHLPEPEPKPTEPVEEVPEPEPEKKDSPLLSLLLIGAVVLAGEMCIRDSPGAAGQKTVERP